MKTNVRLLVNHNELPADFVKGLSTLTTFVEIPCGQIQQTLETVKDYQNALSVLIRDLLRELETKHKLKLLESVVLMTLSEFDDSWLPLLSEIPKLLVIEHELQHVALGVFENALRHNPKSQKFVDHYNILNLVLGFLPTNARIVCWSFLTVYVEFCSTSESQLQYLIESVMSIRDVDSLSVVSQLLKKFPCLSVLERYGLHGLLIQSLRTKCKLKETMEILVSISIHSDVCSFFDDAFFQYYSQCFDALDQQSFVNAIHIAYFLHPEYYEQLSKYGIDRQIISQEEDQPFEVCVAICEYLGLLVADMTESALVEFIDTPILKSITKLLCISDVTVVQQVIEVLYKLLDSNPTHFQSLFEECSTIQTLHSCAVSENNSISSAANWVLMLMTDSSTCSYS